MPDEIVLFFAISMALGLAAALRRSHIFLVMASLNTTLSASLLLLSESTGLVVIVLLSLLNLIFCGVAILAFRSRGRLRMDDFRDLRG